MKTLYRERYFLTTLTNVDVAICDDDKIFTFMTFVKNEYKVIFKLDEKSLYKLYVVISHGIEGDIIIISSNNQIKKRINIEISEHLDLLYIKITHRDIIFNTSVNKLEALTFAEWLRSIGDNIKRLKIDKAINDIAEAECPF